MHNGNLLTVWKLRKFTLTEKIFRQITYLVMSLVKMLLSRNFCQKRVRVNFRNFHTAVHSVHSVEITEIYSQTFVKTLFFLKETTNEMI